MTSGPPHDPPPGGALAEPPAPAQSDRPPPPSASLDPQLLEPPLAPPPFAEPPFAPPAEPPVFSAFEPPLTPSLWDRARAVATDYFLKRDPSFWSALGPLLIVSLILFTRWPGTNYIFDEQEALLANPYVNATGGLRFIDAIHRDFWGLPADRSVGSYRPIPDFFWRALWGISKQPFFHHIYNVFFHAINGAILALIVFAWTKRRGTAYLAGFLFVGCAVLTEAVSGIVGIADVLGGMGALLAVAALSLPAWAMPFAVFTALVFGLFCKESALVCVPLVPFAALLAAPLTHPERPARFFRAALALVATVAGFYLYVELRKRWFLSPLPSELATPPPYEAGKLKHWAYDFLVWFHQAPLPKDPLNNPLADADTPHRIGGALRVYWRGLGQIVFPKTLSGDYSFPQEPVPETPVFFESVAGAAMMVLPLLGGAVLWIVALFRERRARWSKPSDLPSASVTNSPDAALDLKPARRPLLYTGAALTLLAAAQLTVDTLARKGILDVPRRLPLTLAAALVALLGVGLVIEGFRRLPRPDAPTAPVPLGRAGVVLCAIGMVWVVVSYFPHSNIPAVLPTVRAERFWYFPAIGSSLVLAVLWSWFHQAMKPRSPWLVPSLLGLFFVFQGVQAYRHAMNYRSDLDFWEATRTAVPNSAKAHLNYSVMKGARNDLETRLTESKIALSLAPKWPMAHIYTGDTLCRLHRPNEAWAYYKTGFDLGPNEMSLIALALQCLHDEKNLMEHEDDLRALAAAHEGSWIAYLAIDTIQSHEKNNGVDPKYRPRGYNEGPKE